MNTLIEKSDNWLKVPKVKNRPATMNCILYFGENAVHVVPLDPSAEDYEKARDKDRKYPARLAKRLKAGKVEQAEARKAYAKEYAENDRLRKVHAKAIKAHKRLNKLTSKTIGGE